MSNSFTAKSNTQREQQKFFLNTQEIFGIQNINVSFEQGMAPLKFLGMGTPVMLPNGPGKAACSINSFMLGTDRFLNLTGETGFNGYLIKSRDATGENFSFVSGYLTSYNARCSIGEIPEIAVDIVAFGNAGRLTAAESSIVSGHFSAINAGSASFVPSIAGPGSITLNLDQFSTNRVLSYDLQINVSRNAYYPLASRIPNHVKINYPIEVVLNCQFAMNDYEPQEKHNFPLSPLVENLTLTFRNHQTNALINNYTFRNLFLAQESQSAGTDGPVIINATYRAYYGKADAGTAGSAGSSPGS